MADFLNEDAIDWGADGTGQTALANRRFLSDFVNGTLNGLLATPYNVFADIVNKHVNNNTIVFVGDRFYSGGDIAATQFEEYKATADTIGLLVFDYTGASGLITGLRSSVGNKVIDEWKGLNVEGSIVWCDPSSDFQIKNSLQVVFGTESGFRQAFARVGDDYGEFQKINTSRIQHQASYPQVTAFTEFWPMRNVWMRRYNLNYFANLGRTQWGSHVWENVYIDETLTLFTDQGGAIDYNTYFFPSTQSGLIFSTTSDFVVTNNGVSTAYADLAALQVDYPLAFTDAIIFDWVWLGTHTVGEFGVAKGMDLWRQAPTWNGHPSIRPLPDARYIMNSSSSGWTFTNTQFTSDRLEATAATGTAEIEIDFTADQSLGLRNPTLWLSRGLDTTSNTPTVNTGAGSDPTNPERLTFEADYKVVGGAFTGTYYKFHWNSPLGFDNTNTPSGETSFNPTELQNLDIEALRVRVTVQQGAGTAGTGVYGFTVTPSVENFSVEVLSDLDQSPIAGATVTINGESYTTDANGLTELFIIPAGVYPATITAADFAASAETVTVNAGRPYEFRSYELTPLVFSGVTVKFDTAPVRLPQLAATPDASVFCPCDFRCDFEEKVFASDAADGIENDITDFLFKKVAATDTITIRLVKNGVVLATITDNTYGTYYNGFTAQPLYVGWQADWTLIHAAFSGGRYQVQVEQTILGETTTFFSRYFRLNTFDILEADRTVKIETRQNGFFANGEFDFTDLVAGGWPTSIRLDGTFGRMSPLLERDVFQDPSYREVQNRDTVRREYTLKCNLMPETIQERISTQDALANEIFITSYDVLQERKYELFPVVAESFNEPTYDGLGRATFEIVCSDRQKNIIKTNS